MEKNEEKPKNEGFFKKTARNFLKNYVDTATPEVTKAGKKSDSSKKPDYKVNQIMLRDYFFSDAVIRAAIQTDVDNVCAGYDFELLEDTPEAEQQKKDAEELFYRDNYMEKWRNIQLCLGVYDDAYQEVQTFLNEGVLKFDSYIIETPSIEIKNKKTGEVDKYVQKLDGKTVARLEPSDIIHYRFNAFGDRDYGLSLVSTILYSGAIRKFIEKYNGAIFQNHKPRGVWTFPGDMSEDMYNDNVELIIEGKNDPQKDLFLRGTNIKYESFLNQKDVDFQKGYIECRNEILIGLGVPPIMMSLPGDSNKANSDVQLQAYDRRVIAKQNSHAYKTNTELLPRLGFDKIKFVCKKASKRDEERELNIVNKMKGLVTLNEARVQIGYPEFDPAEYPGADEIWSDANPTGETEAPVEEPTERKIEKSLKKVVKKNVKSPVVSLKKEAEVLSPLNKFYDEAISLAKKKVDLEKRNGKFQKAVTDDLMSQMDRMFSQSGMGVAFATFVQGQYMDSGQKMSKKIGEAFQPNQDEITFLRDYNLDQVKTSTDRELANIKRVLEVGFINNQSATDIKKALDKIRDSAKGHTKTLVRTEMNRANNMGSLNAMQGSKAPVKKYLVITNDNRTSEQSKKFGAKYGTPEKAIGLDKIFKITYKNKVYSGLAPPFMPNDRDVLTFTME